MKFDEIMEFDGTRNQHTFDDLAKLLRGPAMASIVPFIGAGLSAPLGFPTWSNFLKGGYKTLLRKDMPGSINFMDAAEELLDAGEMSFYAYVREEYNKPINTRQAAYEAVGVLPKLFNNLVLTTNFDRVLESVYSTAYFAHPGHTEALNRSLLEKTPLIYKILGSIEEAESVIFTKTSYDKAYTEEAPLTQALRRCFSGSILLFLGCSLEQDKTLDLWRKMVPDMVGITHYAILDCIADKIDQRRRELEKQRIRPIFYPDGQHESVRIILEKLLQVVGSIGGSTPNNLPERNIYFSGREDVLEKMRTQFQSHGTSNPRQTLTGMGGSGKTQIAIEYAYRFLNNYKDAIWLVNAETEASTFNDLLLFSLVCGLLPEGEDEARKLSPEQLANRMKDWLMEHREWLFIFDNVYKNYVISPYLSVMRTGHVLITTRNRMLNLGRSIEMDLFTPEEAEAFMRNRLIDMPKLIMDDNALDALIKRFNYFPLALEQAAAYMERSGENSAGYLELLNLNTDGAILALTSKLGRPKATNYPRSVLETLALSFYKLSEGARQFFALCSYMAPEKISLDFFWRQRDVFPKQLRDCYANNHEFNGVVAELLNYSLIMRAGDYISVHRIIQEIMRNYEKESEPAWINICVEALLKDIPTEYDTWERRERFLQIANHAATVAGHGEKAYQEDKDALEKVARLYFLLGVGNDELARYGQALEMYEKTLVIRKKILGEEHPDTATTYNNIAGVYDSQGDYAKALEWLEKARTICEKALGKEHPDTATAYNNIGSVYNNQGDYDKALEWYHKAMAINEKVLGEEHPSTATTYNNIGLVYDNQGDYDKALEWLEKARTIFEKALGNEHPDTATAYNNIGSVYDNQGDYAQALEWFKKALAIRKKVLGPEHSDTATTYNNIGLVYDNQGGYAKALEWFEKALAIREKVLGIEHPSIAITYANIGVTYYSLHRYAEAFQYLHKAVSVFKKQSILNHPFAEKTNLLLSELYSLLVPNESISEQISIAEDLIILREKVDNIKNSLLKYDLTNQDSIVCHYTKLSTLSHLLVAKGEKRKPPRFRLSNIDYLNDPKEGQYLFKILDECSSEKEDSHRGFQDLFDSSVKNTETRKELPLSDVYISSFTNAMDKLPLWKAYGDDCKGCCLVFNADFFQTQILHRVYYVKTITEEKDSYDRGMISAVNNIAQLLTPRIMNMANNAPLKYEVLRILDEIRFLYKSDDYDDEEEVRLVVRADGINKIPLVDRDEGDFPRLFLEIDGDILLDEIILGAKVDNPSAIVPFIRNSNVPKVSISRIEYR